MARRKADRRRVTAADELNTRLNHEMERILRCTVPSAKHGRLLLASPAETRYPYVYPRDAGSAVTLFRRIATSPAGYDCAGQAFELMESTARFMRDVCDSGSWGQRYDVAGDNKGIYRQEDNVAHGIAIICNYILTALKLRREIEDLEGLLACVDSAAAWSLDHLYHTELNLFHSTTSVHESALEEGYTCWVNFSFLYAFSLLDEVARLAGNGKRISRSLLAFRKHFLYSVGELFMVRDRFVRRIDAEGHVDLRPDITLMSPFYFGFHQYGKELESGVRYLEKHLWDPELGMIMRYLPFQKDFAVHVHAGHGPWLQYTAILAQFHFWNGNAERGDELLRLIDSYRNDRGEIPEHLSTCERFERFMQSEWQTGIDFAKEFHKPILLEHVEFDKILEEANNMARSYGETADHCFIRRNAHAGGGYIQFSVPLLWSHVEYARALLVRAGDWWKMKRG